MKLYYSPGACSIGIHVVLEEIGKPYEAHVVSLKRGEQHQPPFVEINPKSKVPTLERDDGSVLTEYAAIAQYLALTNPQSHLFPTDVEAQVRAIEAMDYAVGTVHMQAFTRLFRPANFSPNPADEDKVKERGAELVEKGYRWLDTALCGKDWVAGPYSIADTALFYVSFWGAKRMGYTLPPHLAAHFDRMNARPAVQRVLAAEGLA